MNLLNSKTLHCIILLILFALTFLDSSAQIKPDGLVNSLENKQLNLPSDKLFLHTDRNLYRPGDTIFFQTYIEDRFTQKFETSSLSCWTFLHNTKGEKIDSARFRVDYAMAPGWLALPEDCLPGWYRIDAFSSQMQNYDPLYAFSMWIRVDELIKEKISFEALFNKKTYGPKDTVEISVTLKEKDGEPLKNTSFSYSTLIGNKTVSTYRAKTTRKGNSLLRVYLPDSLRGKNISLEISLENSLGEYRVDIPRKAENPDIRFLPEGGNLISGFPQKIAFNAVSGSGKQLYLRGVLKDDLGNFIDSLKSGSMGPGIVTFTPLKDRKYFAEFSDYPDKDWDLPEISESIPSISVNPETDGVSVDISGGDVKVQYYLALTKNYNLAAFAPFSINGKKRIKFKTELLPPGMALITLFNAELEPIAERTFFIPQKNKPHFKLSTEFDFYYTEQQTSLDITIEKENGTNSSGVFSVAVIDSATALHPQLNLRLLEEAFLFDEDFYTRLPIHIKQRGLLNLTAEELDILMLTYGWTKFNWTSENKRQNKLLNYDQYNIEVSDVHSAKKRRRINNSMDPLFVLSLEEPTLININKKNNNSYILNIDSTPPLTNSIMLVPNVAVKRMLNAAKIETVTNKSYFESFGNRKEQPELNTKLHSNIFSSPVINLDSYRVLKDVSVYANRAPAKKFTNEYEKRYQGVTTKTLDGVKIETAMTLEDLLQRLHPYRLNSSDKTIHFRPARSFTGDPPPALFVLDGVPQETNYKYLMDISPRYIHSVTVLKGLSGYFIYGEDAAGGVVFIETKLNHIGDEYELPQEVSRTGGDLRKVIELFRPFKEFYNPPQEVIQNDPELWIRPTLFWNPEFFYDGENPVAIQYHNHKKEGTVYIIVNGVTIDGEPVSGIHKYEVK